MSCSCFHHITLEKRVVPPSQKCADEPDSAGSEACCDRVVGATPRPPAHSLPFIVLPHEVQPAISSTSPKLKSAAAVFGALEGEPPGAGAGAGEGTVIPVVALAGVGEPPHPVNTTEIAPRTKAKTGEDMCSRGVLNMLEANSWMAGKTGSNGHVSPGNNVCVIWPGD